MYPYEMSPIFGPLRESPVSGLCSEGGDIRFDKIVAFEQQWFVPAESQGIGKAIAEVQPPLSLPA